MHYLTNDIKYSHLYKVLKQFKICLQRGYVLCIICRMSMAKARFVLYFGLLIMLRNVKVSATRCNIHSIQLPAADQACKAGEYTNTSVIEHRQCKLACIHSEECSTIIYDGYRSVCMLLPEPCFLLKPYPGYVYQVIQHLCTKWVRNTDDVGVYWTHEGSGRSYVVRKYVGADLVVGKVTNRLHAISPSGTHIEGPKTGNHEELVVDASCRVTWVAYDSTTGQPIPGGALIGGFIKATNTPLYVSKFAGGVVGYYNPLQRMAWGQLGGIKNGTQFELMVVHPPSTTPWSYPGIWLRI